MSKNISSFTLHWGRISLESIDLSSFVFKARLILTTEAQLGKK